MMTTAKLSAFIIAVVLIFLTLSRDSYGEHRRRFGDCIPGHESCSECYLTLKESLLSNDDNIQKLSAAFFPWNASNPVFITVNYTFNNSRNSEIWYWTTDSSYLFFEITTFQYLSLFFSKPASLFSQKVTLMLDEDCFEANDEMFKLLTQRLKNLIEKKRFNPEIDENYFARSEKNTENLLSFTAATYIFIFHIIGFLVAIGITLLLLWIYFNTKRWDKRLFKMGSERNKFHKYSQSRIFSIALTAGILMLYILSLDITAIVTLKDETPALADRNIDDSILPYVVFSFDSLMVVIWAVCWILSFVTCCNNCRCKLVGKHQYFLQAISTVGPVFTFVIHLPYIAVAYLNDAAYATSSFIYYTVVSFVICGALELTYGTFQQALITRDNIIQQTRHNTIEVDDPEVGDESDRRALIHEHKGDKKEGREGEGDKEEDTDTCDGPCFPFCTKNEKLLKCIWGITIPFFALLVVILIGLTTAALVVVPISKAFSDAPNRLVGFYQTAIVVVGVYFAYKSLFKKKPTLEMAIKKRMKHILDHGSNKVENNKWQRLSKDEKVAAFYEYVVELVAKYDPMQRKLDSIEESDKEESLRANDQENQEEKPKLSSKTISVSVDVHDSSAHGKTVGVGNKEPGDAAAVDKDTAEGDKEGGDSGVVGGGSEERREQ